MRHIYLIRHGRPEFPSGKDCCIGRTNYPLSEEGFHQAKLLGGYFSEIPLSAVYCSTLLRSVQTAGEIAREGSPVIQLEGLSEIDCGLWEGLTFDEIKEKYPERYANRGIDPIKFAPEGGENLTDGLARFRAAMEHVINDSTGDVAVVAHASVNRLFLCSLMNRELGEIYCIPQPYGCINEILQESGLTSVNRTAYMPAEFPDEEAIKALWKRYNTPDSVIKHCRAVAKKAMSLEKKLEEKGYTLNKGLILSAALLHDIARAEPEHASKGARWIEKEGYEKVAAVIAAHQELDECVTDPVSEKTLVFLADKLVSGDREVTLEERFTLSTAKCGTAEAIASHGRKYEQAAAALSRVACLLGNDKI
ncbi:MAG: histidine phosphatase family protein [Oscillospiraceae bacterium]